MVLVGGENVYSSEVERVLQAHPAVLEAAVVGVPESLMGEQASAGQGVGVSVVGIAKLTSAGRGTLAVLPGSRTLVAALRLHRLDMTSASFIDISPRSAPWWCCAQRCA